MSFAPKTPSARILYATFLTTLRKNWLGDLPDDALEDTATNLLHILYDTSPKYHNQEFERMKAVSQLLLTGVGFSGKGKSNTNTTTIEPPQYHTLVQLSRGLELEWKATNMPSTSMSNKFTSEMIFKNFDEEEDDQQQHDNNKDMLVDVENDVAGSADVPKELRVPSLQLRLRRHFQSHDDSTILQMQERLLSMLQPPPLADDHHHQQHSGEQAAGLDESGLQERLFTYFNYSDEEATLVEELVRDRLQLYFAHKYNNSSDDTERKTILIEFTQYLKRAGMADGDDGELGSTSRLDLDRLVFVEGSMLNSSTTTVWSALTKGWTKEAKPGYDVIHVPPAEKAQGLSDRLIPITDLPPWTHGVFKGTTSLNPIQSQVYETAFHHAERNLLCCAPTGSGKTNVAMLTILCEIAKHINGDLSNFKCIYIAPLKALVQEVKEAFEKRLAYLGVKVNELSGDKNLSRRQLENTNIIVTTPEKWNVVTSKVTDGDTSYTKKVSLVIIDEIHLLHNERGSVLEAVVARILRSIEQRGDFVRIVGLSATLPNHADVARFIRAEEVHTFDAKYRPVPLSQMYVGIKVPSAARREALMDEILFEKLKERIQTQHVLCFVHTRKDTARVAKNMLQAALSSRETEDLFLPPSRKHELKEIAATARNADLRMLLEQGIGIHHAGLAREDRNLVEKLFANDKIKMLFSTATLAWGVNLPARTVLIRGTTVYQDGGYAPLSGLDVMQMFGRAGRPQYGESGEAILITTKTDLEYYLTLLTGQLPIESQLMSRVVDFVNMDVSNGSITSVKEGEEWLKYTYWYVRAQQNPGLYKVPPSSKFDDASEPLLLFRKMIMKSALETLEQNGMVAVSRVGDVSSKELGRVAAHYAISHKSISKYNKYLRPNMHLSELMQVFAESDEFEKMMVRKDEKEEVARLVREVPVPILDSSASDERLAKVNVLLQAYISRLRLDGFSLQSDMVVISQSAVRIFRALHQIALDRKWASTAQTLLQLAVMTQKRLWSVQSPIRQIQDHGVPSDLLQRLEGRRVAWKEYQGMSQEDIIGELCNGNVSVGENLHAMIHYIPKLAVVSSTAKPITRGLLQIDVEIRPEFEYNSTVCNAVGESFVLMVTDCDNKHVLLHEPFFLRQSHGDETHSIRLFVPITDPIPPLYFIKLLSENWLGADTSYPLMLNNIFLPDKIAPDTIIDNVAPKDVEEVLSGEREALYRRSIEFDTFTSFQSQLVDVLLHRNDGLVIDAPSGSGKDALAKIAVVGNMLRNPPPKNRVLYLSPRQQYVDRIYNSWCQAFQEHSSIRIVKLTGNVSTDKTLTSNGDIIIATPEVWDSVSVQWQSMDDVVTNIRLVIADDVHEIRGTKGPALEWALSRMRMIAGILEEHGEQPPVRFLSFGTRVANVQDLATWLGVPPNTHTFRCGLAARIAPMSIEIHESHTPGYNERVLCTHRPVFRICARAKEEDNNTIVFAPNKQYATELAQAIMTTGALEKFEFQRIGAEDLDSFLEQEPGAEDLDSFTRLALECGVGILHECLHPSTQRMIEKLFTENALSVLVAPTTFSFNINARAECVVLTSTQHPESPVQITPKEYDADILLRVASRCDALFPSTLHVFAFTPYIRHVMSVLTEPLPVESHLYHDLANTLVKDIPRGVTSKSAVLEALSWSFLHRRLLLNPSYYEVEGTTTRHLAEYESNLVDGVVQELEMAHVIVGGGDMSSFRPTPLSHIATLHRLHLDTIQSLHEMATTPTANSTKDMLILVTQAKEVCEKVTSRYRESNALVKLLQHSRYHCEQYSSTTVGASQPGKAFLLIQAYMDRKALPSIDMEFEMLDIVPIVLRVLHGAVDVATVNRNYKMLSTAIQLCQSVVQGCWQDKPVWSSLLQIPGMNASAAEAVYQKFDTDAVQDVKRKLMSADALSYPFSEEQVRFITHEFPDVHFKVLEASLESHVRIQIHREGGIDGGEVRSQNYPEPKHEVWWVVVSLVVNESESALIGVKRVNNPPSASSPSEVRVDWKQATLPSRFLESPTRVLRIELLCDSYLNADVFEDETL